MFLRPTDGITMNRDRLLADAKAKALELAGNYTPPEPVELRLPGPTARAALDLAVEGFRARARRPRTTWWWPANWPVCSGGDTDITAELGEDELLELERRPSSSWCARPAPSPGSSTCSPPASRCGTEARP